MTTVSELIEQLSKLDQSKKICVDGSNEIYLTYIPQFGEPFYGIDTYISIEEEFKKTEILHQF
jgi:hypothetical protein